MRYRHALFEKCAAEERCIMSTPTYKYWAFISYSRTNQKFAKWLQHGLERFHVPRINGSSKCSPSLRTDKLAPIFRDVDELPASSDLGARLHEALDGSRYLIVICSPSAAQSKWVDAEVAYFLSHGREQDILLLVVDGEPDATALSGAPDLKPFPPSLTSLTREPLWVDARSGVEPRDRLLVRIAAGMLQTGFDDLWQRERRRRRRVVLVWSVAGLLTAGTIGAVFWSQQETLERNRPQNQIAAFQNYMKRSLREISPELKDEEIVISIIRTDNLNNDGLLDFFAFDKSRGSCGSGGCSLDVYVSKGNGEYENVLDLFGHSSPTLSGKTTQGFKDIAATFYMADGKEPIHSIFQWDGTKYQLEHYEFCDGIWREYCSPIIITPVEKMSIEASNIRSNASVYVSPKDGASKVSSDTGETSLVGKVEGKDWFLVQLWKSVSGFVRSSDVTIQ